MPRPLRIEFADALYHVTSRGNARQTLFYSARDRERFLSQLQDNADRYGVRIYAWVLMDNHFHLLVRTPRGNLSRFMQRLNSSYSLYYRYKHQKPGHVLCGRYGARVVEDDHYALAVTRYVHLNPIKTESHKACTKKERIARLESYRWSSYPAYVGRAPFPEWMDDHVLKMYGRNRAEAQKRYRAYVHAAVMENDEPLIALMRRSRYAVGSEIFLDHMSAVLRKKATGTPRDADLALPQKTVSFAQIDEVVCKEYKLQPDTLQRHGSSAGIAKAVAIELAARWSGESLRAIGRHYGGITGQAVAMVRKRFRENHAVDWTHFERALHVGESE